jgi:hypothetical protein
MVCLRIIRVDINCTGCKTDGWLVTFYFSAHTNYRVAQLTTVLNTSAVATASLPHNKPASPHREFCVRLSHTQFTLLHSGVSNSRPLASKQASRLLKIFLGTRRNSCASLSSPLCVCLRACGRLSTRLLTRVYTGGCLQAQDGSAPTSRGRKRKRLRGQEALEDGPRPERK